MKKFQEFIALKENSINDIETLHKIIDIAWEKHRPLLKELLDKLSNNDIELEQEIRKLSGSEPPPVPKQAEKDEVIPPIADRSTGIEDQE